jgi:hypothetical protein
MRRTEQEKLTLYRARVAGIQKHFSNVPSLMIGGTSMLPTALSNLYTDWLAKAQTASRAYAHWLATVEDRDAAEQGLLPVDTSFKRFLLGYYGANHPALVEFGVAAPKVGKKTVATKATAAAKSKATRESKTKALKSVAAAK